MRRRLSRFHAARWLMMRSAVAIGLIVSAPAHAADWLWWEAESPVKTNMPARSPFSPNGAEADVLSGGQWLSTSGPRRGEAAMATYDVNVPAEGTYHLWARKFWKHGPFEFRFDDQPWQTCGRDVALAESEPIRKNVEASWVSLGDVELTAGRHAFEFRLLAKPGEDQTAAFDCFLLTPDAFFPTGKLKPGETTGRVEPGRFSHEPPADVFSPDALLDLRYLNEKTAGQSGPVRRTGDTLTLGDGAPVRFWAVNLSLENASQDRASVDYLARRLAKLGVNMVRFHSALWDDADPRRIDPKKLDHLHYLVATMKRQGIYTTISFYFPLWLEMTPGLGVGGYEELKNKKPFGLVFFEPTFQALYRGWLDGMLMPNNPYTGVPLAKDPAVALVELVNEDSLFFHTFTKKNIPAAAWKTLESRYTDWRKKHFGVAGDAELLDAWHMTRDGIKAGGEAKRARMSAQVRFLADVQRGFFDQTIKHLKTDLGYAGLVDCGNWKTADPELLEAVERWTYEAGDVIDRHGYFGPKLTGDAAGYSVRPGQAWEDRPGLRMPGRLPVWMTQQAGFPSVISELMWTQPSKYRADATAVTAAYASVQGIDGVYFFAQQSNAVRDTTVLKFQTGSPAVAGTFPAAALMYRRGDVTEAPPLRTVTASLEEMFSLRTPLGADEQAFDELRDPSGTAATGTAASGTAAAAIGKIVRAHDTSPPADRTAARDPADNAVTLDARRGLMTIVTPRCVAVVGQLRDAGPQTLGGVTIEGRNDYASVFVISLDGLPLAESKRVLLQAMTDDRPFGFRAENGTIQSVGRFPFTITEIDATVTLPGQSWRGTVLDANGMKARTLEGATLARDALYTVYER